MSELLATHRRLLAQWRRAMNLVGPGEIDEHYRDAELGLSGLDPVGRWADLGTGAGFPGIVFAARFPEVGLDLVDSRKKRCAFLRQVLAEAAVDPDLVRVVQGRVEDLPAAGYDGLTARAFAPPGEVFAHARRLLRPEGRLVLFLQDDGPLPTAPGFEVFHVEHYVSEGRARRAVQFVVGGGSGERST